jgi:hypothetical protein
MTALSMLVKTCCFMWSRSTAVMTVRLGTETTNAGALAGGALDAVVEAAERGRAHVDPAPLDALQRVRREAHRLRLTGAEHLGERRAAGALRRRRRWAAGRREAGRQQRRVVLDDAHRTDVTAVGSTPVRPPTLSVAVPSLSRSRPSTVPLADAPSMPV